MARTIPAAVAAQLAAGVSTLARCVRLVLADGSELGVTDHDVDLEIDLTGQGPLAYSAAIGALPSAVSLSVGLAADSFEITGPVCPEVSREAVLGGRFDQAHAWIFDADWSASPPGVVPLMRGRVAGARIEGGRYVLEVRSAADAFNQSIGRVLSAMCSHDLGDARCTVPLAGHTYAAAVSAVTSDFAFQVAFTGDAPADGALDFGTCEFQTGALAGTRPVEIFSRSGANVVLYAPLAAAPEVGDAVNLIRGCDKLRSTCRDVFGNVPNFGGFPDAPGSDQYLQWPIPGAAA